MRWKELENLTDSDDPNTIYGVLSDSMKQKLEDVVLDFYNMHTGAMKSNFSILSKMDGLCEGLTENEKKIVELKLFQLCFNIGDEVCKNPMLDDFDYHTAKIEATLYALFKRFEDLKVEKDYIPKGSPEMIRNYIFQKPGKRLNPKTLFRSLIVDMKDKLETKPEGDGTTNSSIMKENITSYIAFIHSMSVLGMSAMHDFIVYLTSFRDTNGSKTINTKKLGKTLNSENKLLERISFVMVLIMVASLFVYGKRSPKVLKDNGEEPETDEEKILQRINNIFSEVNNYLNTVDEMLTKEPLLTDILEIKDHKLLVEFVGKFGIPLIEGSQLSDEDFE